MKWLALPILFLAVSCGPGQPSYGDRVRALSDDQAHPLYLQLLPLVEKPSQQPADQLMQTWKEFLGAAPLPLRSAGNFTFVYYDYSDSLEKVFLEASFAPDRLEPMSRVGKSSLFVRVYSIPRPAQARYRFSNGESPLPDPFHTDLEPGEELWQPLVTTDASDPTAQWITGSSEPLLQGQDLRILLPPFYRTNLAMTYPLVLLVGIDGPGWILPLDQLQREGSVRPVIVVSVGSAVLKSILEDRVVPWMRSRYRASKLASDLVLVGWGASAKAVLEKAAARPDFWTRTWAPLSAQARGPEGWATLAPSFFRAQFPLEAP